MRKVYFVNMWAFNNFFLSLCELTKILALSTGSWEMTKWRHLQREQAKEHQQPCVCLIMQRFPPPPPCSQGVASALAAGVSLSTLLARTHLGRDIWPLSLLYRVLGLPKHGSLSLPSQAPLSLSLSLSVPKIVEICTTWLFAQATKQKGAQSAHGYSFGKVSSFTTHTHTHMH